MTATIATAAPDAIVLVGFDYDYELAALSALAARLAERGAVYPYRFAYPPNAGVATGFDLDGDGRLGGPGDAQGWGRFAGAGGLALLSRLPVLAGQSRDLSPFLWRDLPGGSLAALTAAGALPAAAAPVLRLSTVAAWDVALDSPAGPLHLLTFAAGPPVFDGPEDRNGRRNADELGFWAALLDGRLKIPPPAGPIVLLGDANLDPDAGAGRRSAIRALLAHPRLQDPLAGAGPTVDWPPPKGPGKLRVDYILPGAGLRVTDAGIAPADGGSRHRLLWLDLELR